MTEPTPTQTRLGEAERDEFQRGYLPLVLVEVIVALLEQTASQVLAGEIESDRVPFVLIEIAVLGEITDEMLRGQPPQPELEEAWTLGREALSLIQDIMTGWWHDEIAAEGIPQATEPVRALMRRAMQVADAGIASRYGIGEAELAAFRAKTVEEFRSTVGDVNAPE